MKFDNKCIRCGTEENIDTVITVTVNDVKYKVALCEEHAEDTTPKQVKVLVNEKLEKLKKLMEELKEYGMDVDDMNGIAVAKKAKKKAEKVEETEEEEGEEEEEEETIIKKTSKDKARIIKKGYIPKVKSISGNVDGQNIPGASSLNTKETAQRAIPAGEKAEVPITEDVEYQVVPGRCGVPMRIPKRIKHNQGSTKVSVVDTGGDQMIQTRFKEFARSTMNDERSHIYGRDGYDTTECALCAGTGLNRVNGGKCKKCNGIGLINRGFIRT
jgi:hypothetical protein